MVSPRAKKIAAVIVLLAAVIVAGYVLYNITLKPSYAIQYMTYDTVNGTVSVTQGNGYAKYAISGEATLNMTVSVAVKDPYRLHKLEVKSLVENLTNMQVSAFGLRFGLVYSSNNPPANDTWINATLTGTGLYPTAVAVKFLNISGTIKLQVYVNNTLCGEFTPKVVQDSDLGITLLHIPVTDTRTCITVPANCTLTLVDKDTHDHAMVTLNLFYTFDLVNPAQSGSADVKITGYGARK